MHDIDATHLEEVWRLSAWHLFDKRVTLESEQEVYCAACHYAHTVKTNILVLINLYCSLLALFLSPLFLLVNSSCCSTHPVAVGMRHCGFTCTAAQTTRRYMILQSAKSKQARKCPSRGYGRSVPPFLASPISQIPSCSLQVRPLLL